VAAPSPPESKLQRLVGPIGATAMVAGSMLGIGIFLTPRLVALEISSVPWFFAIWGLGGLVSLGGAVAYAELGVRFPHAGGDYVYLRETWGESAAVAAGWVLLAGVFGGSLATLAAAVSRYQAPVILPGFAPDALLLGPWTQGDALALVVLLLLTTLNAAGVRPSSFAQNVLTVVPGAVMILVAVHAFVGAPHESATAVPVETESSTGPLAIAAAFLHVYFAYSGWNAVSYAAEEVREPERNLPRGLLLGTISITALYVLLCAAFVVTLGLGGLRDAFEAGTATATALYGNVATVPVAALIAASLLSSLNATVLCGGRTAFAMARDNVLPRQLAHVSPATHVPTRALWLQAAFAAALVLTGTFEQLLEMTTIAMFVLGALTVAGLFRLRRRPGDEPPAFRASGYPWLPGLYIGVSVLVVGLTSWQVATDEEKEPFALLGLGALVLLFIAHVAWQRRRAR
jgi:APA family basic amino acid/polyamine antiporter